MRFKDKYAIVTGAASGIGRNLADKLYEEGATVFGLDINECINANFKHFICDVSNEEQVIKVLDEIKKTTNNIDYLVNIAGVLTIGKKVGIKSQTIEQWNSILNVNLTSVLIMMKNTYELLKKSNSPVIVNMSSDQTFKVLKNSAPYIVSKCGINTLTKLAALEMYKDNIRVNAVATSSVRSNFLKSLTQNKEIINDMFISADEELPFGIIETDDVANIICFLLSDGAKKITGQIILVDSGKLLI